MERLRIMGLIEPIVEKSPNKIALIGHNGESLTYKQLGDSVKAMGNYLTTLGIQPNQRIAFVSRSALETAIAFLAISNIAAFAPLSPDYSELQYKYYFDLLKIDALMIPENYQGPLFGISTERKRDVFYLRPKNGNMDIKYEIIGVVEKTSPTTVLAHGHDIAMVNYTSGTTAQPKIVPRSHINICTAVQKRITDFSLTTSDRTLNITPMFRSVGLNSVLAALFSGGTAICADDIEPNHFFHLLNETSPTYFAASPVVFQTIVEYAEQNALQFKDSSLRFVRSTGAKLTETLADRIKKVFNVPVHVSYGMTETGGISNSSSAPQGQKPGSVGVPVQIGVVIANEKGQQLKANVEGEILVCGPQVIKRYDNDERTNQESFYGEWFRTGDAGYLDEDGYLFITGRFKEIINRGGEKVSPYEVEEALLLHPGIKQAVIFPVHGVEGNEEVGAALVLKAGTNLYLKDLRHHLQGRIAAFKMPTILYVLDVIPVGEGGKIQRTKLYETIQSLGLKPQPVRGEHEKLLLPRNETEKALLKIFTRILPIKNISITDNFFELGGDSLKAAVLYDSITEQFGIQIPLKYIFENSSIEELASYILGKGDYKTIHPFLVPFQEGGSKTPIFFIHATEGEPVIYRHIAMDFDSERPFYGIKFNPDAVKWKHPITFEQVARYYIDDIRTIQSTGPYILAGQCVGGIIAYEMARQLKDAKQDISLLAMYDPIVSSVKNTKSINEKLRSNIEELKNVSIKQYLTVKYFYYSIRLQSALYKITPDLFKPLCFRYIKNESWIKYARSVYKIKPYNGDIVYFYPEEASGESSELSSRIWAQFVRNIRIIPLRGRHDSVFFAENAENTRKILEKVLEEIPENSFE